MADNGNDLTRTRVIHAVLERQAAENGNRTFLYFKDKEYSFEDVNRAANRVACGLQKIGIKKNDKVSIMLDNCPEYLFVWFGISKLGAVEVPVNTAHKGDLLSYMLNLSDTTMMVLDGKYLDRIEPILRDVPGLKYLVVFGGDGKALPKHDGKVFEWPEVFDNDGVYKQEDVLWSDPFIIMFTSGTTGPSKGSLMPHNYGLYMADICCEAAEYGERDCLYNVLPLFHGNAQVLSTLPALLSGARMVLGEKFSASRFWDDVNKFKCTEFNYIGGIVPILYKADPKPGDANNSLRIMFGAGAPEEIFEPFQKRFAVTLVEGYGMTEIGIPLVNTLKDNKPGTCGRIYPGYSLRVVDDNGFEVGPNTPGELLIRPSKQYSMMLEYYKMPEKTVDAWQDLWFHTGDYLRYDDDGYFYFIDRKKDALRRRGENISSFEVENTINSHPAVMESAAIAVKSPMGEDEVMVCLSLKPGESLQPERLIDFCSEKMAYFMVPRYLRFMRELPKTPTQKIQKQQLRQEGVTADTWDIEETGYKVRR
ncbi:MAG: AMP-binding protein [Syntrophorhabdaceae bacterium]|nr:AMP-binding protein [Syntrophorhabdaceae bacterium]